MQDHSRTIMEVFLLFLFGAAFLCLIAVVLYMAITYAKPAKAIPAEEALATTPIPVQDEIRHIGDEARAEIWRAIELSQSRAETLLYRKEG